MEKKALRLRKTTKVMMITLMLGVLGMMNGYAEIKTIGDLVYDLNTSSLSATIIRHKNESSATGTLVIPETVTYNGNTYHVNSIGQMAFYYCSNLSGCLIIPNTITSIGDAAFFYCTGFSEVQYKPADCTVVNPSYTYSPFYGCNGQLVIDFGVESIPDYMFKGATFTGELIIPNSVTEIGSSAFSLCSGFTGILTIPNSVTRIGSYAFRECVGFSAIDISNTVTTIEDDAFIGCSNIISVNIGSSLSFLGNGAFYNCSSIQEIIVDTNNEAFDSRDNCNAIIKTTTNSLVVGCKNTIIPNSVTSIGVYAFAWCSGLTSIAIPYSVTSIGMYAFAYCSGINSMMVYAENPPVLNNYAFSEVNKSIPVYVPCGTISAYQAASGWNEFTNYQELPPSSVTQTIDLSADWNWWSTNVDITLGELKEALGSNGLKIVAQDGKFAAYNTNNGTWSGNLQGIELGKMYKVKTNEACSITLNGAMADPNEHPITLYPGNNWIGFISNESMSLDEAFGNFVPTDRDVIKASNGKATYYQGYGWQGSLNTLEPGKGYIYKSNATESRTFTYPSAK